MVCKSNISGIKELFLVPYIHYPRRHFLGNTIEFVGELRINPIYLLNASGSQNFSNGYYNQSLNFKTPNLINNELISDFEKKIYRAILKDGSNNYWMLGTENGLTLKSNNGQTGVNKNEFSGYDLTFEGIERNIFTQLENIEQFIENAVLFLSSSSELSSSSILSSQTYI